MGFRALLIVDLQNAVFDGTQIPPVSGAERLLGNAGALLQAARQAALPVIHIQHCGKPGEALEEGGPGWPIYAPFQPQGGEPVVQKRASSAFDDTELQSTLQRLGVRSFVVTGIQSELCIAATCRGALELGYEVVLAEDGHGTWPANDRTADEIVASQNEDLRRAKIALRRTEELVAAIGRRRGQEAAD